MVKGQFTKLFEPGRIGKLELKNRIIFPPMVTRYTKDGRLSEQILNYYAERARGGCGLIVIEASYPRSGGYPERIYLDNDEAIPDLRRLVEVIHNGEAKAAIQLNPHRGRVDEVDPASASENIQPKTGIRARAMSVDDIKQLVNEFGEGARRAKEAGFDCIMIHGGSGYLVSDFLSPRLNRRVDDYGGDIKKRARLALELVAVIKEKMGADYPIIYRLTADERIEGGFGLKDAIVVSKLLEEAGVDAIDIVSGVTETFNWMGPYMYIPRGYNASLSEAIKNKIKIPVSVGGRINDPYIAEGILRDGKADFVALGRALIADPHFPRKAIMGQVDDICMCPACGRCYEDLFKLPMGPLMCTVNLAVGREKEFELGLRPAIRGKRVLVVGGGPGGMEAAVIAAQRKHNVTLWEKDNRLGGQLNIAVIPPGKDELNSIAKYLKHHLNELKVEVELGKEATAEKVLEFSPDVVIVAVGSKPLIPEIKGVDRRRVVFFRDVLSGKVDVGKSVIVVGGGFMGCETADFLAEKDKKVTIVEVLAELATEIFYPYAELLVEKLKKNGVEIFTSVKEEEITEKGMEIVDRDGNRVLLEADDIVMASGSVADRVLFESLKGEVSEVYEVGDCREPRRIQEAIYEGAEVGLKI